MRTRKAPGPRNNGGRPGLQKFLTHPRRASVGYKLFSSGTTSISICKNEEGRIVRLTTAVIVNLTEENWTLHRSYGTYRVRGCESGEPYALSRIEARTAVMDLGDKRTLDVPISAAEVAQDLCREINSDGGDESFFGVFVAADEM